MESPFFQKGQLSGCDVVESGKQMLKLGMVLMGSTNAKYFTYCYMYFYELSKLFPSQYIFINKIIPPNYSRIYWLLKIYKQKSLLGTTHVSQRLGAEGFSTIHKIVLPIALR